MSSSARDYHEILAFWFPEARTASLEADRHADQWFWRMRGGADAEIVARFPEITAWAARGELAHWAADPAGRLALIIVLDQFSRSLWRGSPRAFAQDPA